MAGKAVARAAQGQPEARRLPEEARIACNTQRTFGLRTWAQGDACPVGSGDARALPALMKRSTMRQPINNVEEGRSPADNRCPRRAAGQEGSAERKRGAPVCPAAWAFTPSGSARGIRGNGWGLGGDGQCDRQDDEPTRAA